MRTSRITTILGARPQFIKAAAVSRAFGRWNESAHEVSFHESLVHTGQHYDDNMSKVFFDELHIPQPTVNLGVGSGRHGEQTAEMLRRIGAVLLADRPDWVVVYGDTNSTLAGALAASKLGIPIAHIEAGLRSFNRRMPEEINRVLTDRLSRLLLCPTEAAVHCLAAEGITRGVHRVGDVMYDSVLHNMAASDASSHVMERLGLTSKAFYLATVHRQENTDDDVRLEEILSALQELDRRVIIPVHPRMRNRTAMRACAGRGEGRLVLTEPVSYLDMLQLEKHARVILTDSGGVQKEAYWLGVPCVTLRDETEWVELVELGCNQVVGADKAAILAAVDRAECGQVGVESTDPARLYGDGYSADRMVRLLAAAVDEGPGLQV